MNNWNIANHYTFDQKEVISTFYIDYFLLNNIFVLIGFSHDSKINWTPKCDFYCKMFEILSLKKTKGAKRQKMFQIKISNSAKSFTRKMINQSMFDKGPITRQSRQVRNLNLTCWDRPVKIEVRSLIQAWDLSCHRLLL